MTPEAYLHWLDREIELVEHCKDGQDNSYLGIMWRGEHHALSKVKEKFLTIEFNTPSTDNENSFTEGLE